LYLSVSDDKWESHRSAWNDVLLIHKQRPRTQDQRHAKRFDNDIKGSLKGQNIWLWSVYVLGTRKDYT